MLSIAIIAHKELNSKSGLNSHEMKSRKRTAEIPSLWYDLGFTNYIELKGKTNVVHNGTNTQNYGYGFICKNICVLLQYFYR